MTELPQLEKTPGEDPDIDVPVTGWARFLSLKEGKWSRYNPKRVKIPALHWMEKDVHKQSHWFELDPAQAILGVMFEPQGERFAYAVTRPSSGGFVDFHDPRMPLFVRDDGLCGALRLLEQQG
jgi:hypothetical protein